MSNLTDNQKLAICVIREHGDQDVIREVTTCPNYSALAPYVIDTGKDFSDSNTDQNKTYVTKVEQSEPEIRQVTSTASQNKESTPSPKSASCKKDADKKLDQIESAREASDMNTITRNELQSKLSEIESKADLRIEKFSNEMLQVIAELRVERADRDAKLAETLTKIETEQAAIKAQLEPLKNVRQTVWRGVATSIGVIAAILIAIIALGITSFDSGRDTSKDIQQYRYEMLEKSNLRDNEIKSINETLKELAELVKESNKKAE